MNFAFLNSAISSGYVDPDMYATLLVYCLIFHLQIVQNNDVFASSASDSVEHRVDMLANHPPFK